MEKFYANTNSISENIDTLKNYQSYYEEKQSVFLTGSFQSGGTLVSNYLEKINRNYRTIAKNIENFLDYLNKYRNDIDIIEKDLSNNSFGVIFDINSRNLVSKYRNSLKELKITKEELFPIMFADLFRPNLQKVTLSNQMKRASIGDFLYRDYENLKRLKAECETLKKEYAKLNSRNEQLSFVLKIIDENQVSKEACEIIVSEWIQNKEIYNLSTLSLFLIMENNENLCHKLVNTYKFKKSLAINLKNGGVSNVLKNLNEIEYNKILNDPIVKQELDKLDTSTFFNFIHDMPNYENAFLNKAILDKILTLNEKDFFAFIANYGADINASLSSAVKENRNMSSYYAFLKEVQKKYLTEGHKENFIESYKDLESLYTPLLKESSINSNTKSFEEALIYMENKIVQENSQVHLEINNNRVQVPIDKQGWYEVKLNIKGDIYTYYTKAKDDNKLDLNKMLQNDNFRYAFVQNNASILAIEWSEQANKLYFENLENVNYRIDMVVDGKLQTFVEKPTKEGILNLMNYLAEIARVEDVQIKKLPKYNNEKTYADGIYLLTATRNGKKIPYYIEAFNKHIDIDNLILTKNLYDIEDIDIQPVNKEDIDFSKFNINRYSAGKDVFNNEMYGGNQSNAKKIFQNENPTETEIKKMEDMKEIMQKYYPDITPLNMEKLTSTYSNVGCAYMAVSNAIATFFGSQENGAELFKEQFGYDLYYMEDGQKNYNVESIALDIFMVRHENLDEKSLIEEGTGLSNIDFGSTCAKYLKEKGVTVSYENILNAYRNGRDTSYNSLLVDLLEKENDNTFYFYLGANFDMTPVSEVEIDSDDQALQNVKTDDSKTIHNVGGHAVIITGVSEEGDILVSSWGREFEINEKGYLIDDDTEGILYAVNFELNN